MAQSSMTIEITNTKTIMKDIVKKQANGAKAVNAVCKEFKTRAPAWISQAITQDYTIKKKDINSNKKGAKVAGKIKVAGVSVDNIQIEYQGRLLTPTHFKMTPRVRPQRKYVVRAEIKKGAKKVLGSRVFLGGTGGEIQIPFQREEGAGRLPIKAVKTVSVPQMISAEETSMKIQELIDENMKKRLDHHIDRFNKM